MSTRPTDGYYTEIQKELEFYFHELYWRDILQLVKDSERRINSRSLLLDAIRSGRVQYQSGVFTGKFNVALSKELSKFAKYDGRSKVWRGIPPADVISAATVANDRGRKLAQRIQDLANEIPARVEAAISNLKYSIEGPTERMAAEAGESLKRIGISVEMTPELTKRLIDEYKTNQDLNIKNWTDEQVTRLRDMIEKNALSGYNRRELQQLIQTEYGVSMNKARFLARTETTLFVSKVRDARYQDAGINKYRWSSSQDIRVRPLHRELNGRVFLYSSPPIIDERTGERGHPGGIYNCRCVAIPVP